MYRSTVCSIALAFLLPQFALAQGQDSTKAERDAQVIAELLPGVWNNNNQRYFDGRTRADEKHGRLHVVIERGEQRSDLQLRLTWDNADAPASSWRMQVIERDAQAIMTVRDAAQATDAPACTVRWQREAAQFRGTTAADRACENLPATWILAEQQLWLEPLDPPDADAPQTGYKLHRTRAFRCYADIPGVGGGRDEPYERYGEFTIHDGGGLARFTSKDDPARDIGIYLWRVDWPINNYAGVFTRDVLVISVLEFMPDGTVADHGYAFTEPQVGRVGINLKWMLASCYMQSNAEQAPFM